MPLAPIHFCNHCGAPVRQGLPNDGDTRERAICTGCGHIHYQNPLNVAGTIVQSADGRILLCQRNIEPQRGRWTLPAGFMELGETLMQAAARETQEEAGADIQGLALHSVISAPAAGQVHFFYRARARSLVLNPGPETLRADFFAVQDIDFQALAFSTVRRALELFVADVERGCGHTQSWSVHECAV